MKSRALVLAAMGFFSVGAVGQEFAEEGVASFTSKQTLSGGDKILFVFNADDRCQAGRDCFLSDTIRMKVSLTKRGKGEAITALNWPALNKTGQQSVTCLYDKQVKILRIDPGPHPAAASKPWDYRIHYRISPCPKWSRPRSGPSLRAPRTWHGPASNGLNFR